MIKAAAYEILFWIGIAIIAIVVNFHYGVAGITDNNGPVKVFKNGSGSYTVSLFGRKSFDEKYALVSKFGKK